jgi:hypothetical protein
LQKFYSGLIGPKKCLKAIDEAEKLSKDLKDRCVNRILVCCMHFQQGYLYRYDKKQAEIVSEKMLEENEKKIRQMELERKKDEEKEEAVVTEEKAGKQGFHSSLLQSFVSTCTCMFLKKKKKI